MTSKQEQARLKKQKVITDFVTEHYLTESVGCVVKQIAAGLKISEAIVRKHIDGCRGLHSVQENRETHSKMYPGFQQGGHKVRAYYPSRGHLAQLLKDARGKERSERQSVLCRCRNGSLIVELKAMEGTLTIHGPGSLVARGGKNIFLCGKCRPSPKGPKGSG